MIAPTSANTFSNGLVFGFDVGTGSIGYAVRKGDNFKDVGVLICPEDTNDLSGRRGLRRQRRTLRSRKARRAWFARELEKLGLPKPQQPPNDPIALRLRALNGEKLKSEELHAALTHLFKRRGYSKVPWANTEKAVKETAKTKKDDDEGEVMKAAIGIKAEMEKRGCQHPCQYLVCCNSAGFTMVHLF
jgi:CRISPR/Cas system Type II protein with McrA/HNH and RuvC-like nuclease domain